MYLSRQHINRLNSIISTAQKMLALTEQEEKASGGRAKRNRRSSADAEKMRAQIRAARAKGVPATKLAEKYGVSTAYIYMTK